MGIFGWNWGYRFIFCKQKSPDIYKSNVVEWFQPSVLYLYNDIMYSIWYSAVYYLMI